MRAAHVMPARPSNPWVPAVAVIGFAAMYLPTYWDAAHGLWQTDENGHAPLVLLIAAWLAWRSRGRLAALPPVAPSALAWLVLGVGCTVYVFARLFGISSLEFLSQILVLCGVLALMRGWAAPAALWFPLIFLLFAVPLPSALTDALTGPLKQWISEIVVDSMYAFGYPIARSGVIIAVGSYQLLVADACSGINSMVSLSALGLLFMYLMPRQSRLHNALMLVALLPIAFLANLLRVVLLVLITYHLGDEAGQGFLHGMAGLVLSLAALAFIFGMDRLLHSLLGRWKQPATPGQPPAPVR